MTVDITETAEKAALEAKVSAFKDGLTKLEADTGMTLVPMLDFNGQKLEAIIRILPKTK